MNSYSIAVLAAIAAASTLLTSMVGAPDREVLAPAHRPVTRAPVQALPQSSARQVAEAASSIGSVTAPAESVLSGR